MMNSNQAQKLEELTKQAEQQRTQAEEQIRHMRSRPKQIAVRAAKKIVKSNPILLYRISKIVLPIGLTLSRTVYRKLGPVGLVSSALIAIASYGIGRGIKSDKLRQEKATLDLPEDIEEDDISDFDD